jgi:DNA polymerase elongation subunit (family B)
MRFYTNVACQGNYIYYRGIDEGRRVRLKMEYSPTLFMPSNAPTIKGREYWKNLQGEIVDAKEFNSITEAREFIKSYEDVEGFTIYGNSKFEYSFIADQHPEELMEWQAEQIVTAFIDIEVGTEHGMPDINLCNNPITAITVKLSNDPKYYAFGCKDYTPHRPDIHWNRAINEVDLLNSFLSFWNDKAPDVVTGWNVKTFDIPYLVGRMVGLPEFGEDKARWLSPWGRVNRREETFYNKPQSVYQLLGISILDYMQLFRKYAPNAAQESYKLDHIAHVELKERKTDYSEYETLHNLYRDNYQKFIEYNIHDVELVQKLDDKGKLISMAFTLAYDNKTNYEDCFSQVRMWDAICYNHLRRKGIVIPPKKHTSKDQAYEGAYVKDPQLGLHEYICSLDLNSLYPHLMMQYNMSPETIIDPKHYTDAHRKILQDGVNVNNLLYKKIDLSFLGDSTITPNGQFFTKMQYGFLPEIMQKMYNDRVVYKKKQIAAQKEKEQCTDPVRKKELEAIISRYKNLQLAKKVGLNSAYGAMGNEYFRFFDVRVAEGITLAGQLSIRWIENKLNEFMNKLLSSTNVDYVLASDTDSVYLNLGPLVKKVYKDTSNTAKIIEFMDKVCQQKLQPFIDTSYQELADYTNAYEQKMQMKRESLVDKAIWTAKKRYILNVWDLEGVRYKEPELKIQGLEAIKSSTPSACRDKIKEAIKIIITGTEDQLIAYIGKFREEFKALPISDIAFPRGMNGLGKYTNKDGKQKWETSTFMSFDAGAPKLSSAIYISGTPIHVKGALVYNHFLKEMKLDKNYETIREGEKIKFVHLKPHNQFGESVMSFIGRIPKEFKLETCVDYDMQFEKSFVEPLNIILSCIGWHSEKTSTLEDFFG